MENVQIYDKKCNCQYTNVPLNSLNVQLKRKTGEIKITIPFKVAPKIIK